MKMASQITNQILAVIGALLSGVLAHFLCGFGLLFKDSVRGKDSAVDNRTPKTRIENKSIHIKIRRDEGIVGHYFLMISMYLVCRNLFFGDSHEFLFHKYIPIVVDERTFILFNLFFLFLLFLLWGFCIKRLSTLRTHGTLEPICEILRIPFWRSFKVPQNFNVTKIINRCGMAALSFAFLTLVVWR